MLHRLDVGLSRLGGFAHGFGDVTYNLVHKVHVVALGRIGRLSSDRPAASPSSA